MRVLKYNENLLLFENLISYYDTFLKVVHTGQNNLCALDNTMSM